MKWAVIVCFYFLLTACVTSNSGEQGGPVKVFLDGSATSGTHVAAMLPLGNESLDSGGMDNIAAQAAKIPGVTRVYMYNYYQTLGAALAITQDPAGVKEVVIGFSCGANASPVVAADTKHRVDAVAVIQVSEWCGGTPLTGNVMKAQETYNPNCWDTGGLGCGRLVPGSDFDPSNLTFISRPDCHTCSDHNPDAVNDILDAIRAVTSPTMAMRYGAVLGKRAGKPNVIVRFHGERIY